MLPKVLFSSFEFTSFIKIKRKVGRRKLLINMQNVYSYHRELDDLALHFLLEPTHGISIKDRCRQYAFEISDERFHELTECVLNGEYVLDPRRPYASYENRERRSSFIRALKMYGFNVEGNDQEGYEVEPKFLPDRLRETKEEVETLLDRLNLNEIQGSLNIAEEQYIKGEFAKSFGIVGKL